MKQLQKFISNDNCWIIEEKANGNLCLSKNCDWPTYNQITFVKSDIGTLVGILNKLDQVLNHDGTSNQKKTLSP